MYTCIAYITSYHIIYIHNIPTMCLHCLLKYQFFICNIISVFVNQIDYVIFYFFINSLLINYSPNLLNVPLFTLYSKHSTYPPFICIFKPLYSNFAVNQCNSLPTGTSCCLYHFWSSFHFLDPSPFRRRHYSTIFD